MKASWKPSLLKVLVISLVGADSAVVAQSMSWTPIVSKEFQFSVTFCTSPKKDQTRVDRKKGVIATLNLFKGVAKDFTCAVSLADYSTAPDVEQEFKLNQSSIINATKGTLRSSHRAEFVYGGEKLPALTFSYVARPDLAGKATVIIRGRRVYMAIFQYHGTKDYSAAGQKFLDSFQITN
jgi:hypothetical protein